MSADSERKRSILFVCLGNICRSPAAEAILKHKLKLKGIANGYFIDSAGIHGYHSGEEADPRMIRHAARRGIIIDSVSRQIKFDDFSKFDYIIGMDDSNIRALKSMAKTSADLSKISKMTDYSVILEATQVPDPYYGGYDGFERVLDILDDSINGLLKHLES